MSDEEPRIACGRCGYRSPVNVHGASVCPVCGAGRVPGEALPTEPLRGHGRMPALYTALAVAIVLAIGTPMVLMAAAANSAARAAESAARSAATATAVTVAVGATATSVSASAAIATAVGHLPTAPAATSTAVPPPIASGAAATVPVAQPTAAATVTSASAPTLSAPVPTGTPALAPTAAPGPARDEVTVIEVVDGDTIKVRFGHGAVETVRYIGIDTPETVDPGRPVMCFGKEATAKNAELVGDRTVQLERDVSERDRFGRLLRYVWVAGADGATRMVNEELVTWGFAQSSTFPPDVKYQPLFVAAQREAQAEKRGLWGACSRFGEPAVTPTSTPLPAVAPAQPTVAPATGGVTLVSVVGGRPGSRASVTAQAPPGASCSITYVTPAGTVSVAQGLVAQQVPASGRVTWTWMIGTTTRPGTGSVTVSCSPGGRASAGIQIG